MEFLPCRLDCGWGSRDRYDWPHPSVEIHNLPTNERYLITSFTVGNFSHHDICPDDVRCNDRNIPLQMRTVSSRVGK